MKKLFLVTILLFIFISVYGQNYETILISDGEDLIGLSGQEAVRISGSTIYLIYKECDYLEGVTKICFAYSSDSGVNFNKIEIDVIGTSDQYSWLEEPVIEIIQDGSVIIVYTKFENDIKNLYRALSDVDADNFEIQLIEENISDEIHLIEKNGLLTLTYQQSDSTGINQFSVFQYFTDKEESVNADGGYQAGSVKFWGLDVFQGPVHSNDDIWIQQAGGGTNNGWPTFWGPVTTAGIFRKYPSGERLEDSGAPMDEMFRGGDPGWEEHVEPVEFPETADQIRENGLRPFAGSNADIVSVKLNGDGYESRLGYRELIRVDSIKVYSWYPHDAETAQAIIDAGGNWFEESEHIWTNSVPIYEINWTEGPAGTVNDQSVWVESELWIEGTVNGMQTWGCADTVYITGDIIYSNTDIGDLPDDDDNSNTTDFFGLVSEEQILIKYKHYDAWSGELIEVNCDGVYLYGAYAALGKGDTLQYGNMACHYDGIFSYEYQHPHGSTPDFAGISPYTGNDTLYTYIDLHKYIYPINNFVPPQFEMFNLHGNNPPTAFPCGYPYESNEYLNSYPNNSYGDPDFVFQIPYGTDLPWYNPVWPESAEEIIYERGYVHLYGSMIQRRRGFIHRSGTDPYNHDGNEWDINNYQYDGTHPSTGYGKDYYYDTRFLDIELVDFPSMNECYNDRKLMLTYSENGGESFTEPYALYDEIMFNVDKTYFAENDEKIILSLQNSYKSIFLFESIDNGLSFNFLDNIYMNINNNSSMFYKSTNLTQDDILYFCGKHSFYETVIDKYDLDTENLDIIYYEQCLPNIYDFNISYDGVKMYTNLKYWENPPYISINYSSENDLLGNEVQWMPDILEDMVLDNFSELILQFDESDSLYMFLYTDEYASQNQRKLYLIKGYIEGVTPETEDEITPAKMELSVYPNPFNPTIEIRCQGSGVSFQDAKLMIYNIKGQKIKTLAFPNGNLGMSQDLPLSPSQDHSLSVTWDGKDENGHPVGSGIYFARVKADGQVLQKKMVLIK